MTGKNASSPSGWSASDIRSNRLPPDGARPGQTRLGKAIRAAQALFSACLLGLLCAAPVSAEPNAIAYVKNSYFSKCPNRTVEKHVDSAFESPHWSSSIDSAGQALVTVSGAVAWQGRSCKAQLQWIISPGRIAIASLKLNDLVVSESTLDSFILTMCSGAP